MKFKRTLITTALPYANGPLHIGHMAGVYIPADIYARYLRLKKQDVLLIGGSDEHGVPITLKAKAEGIHPQEVVDRYHRIIKKAFQDFGISFDIYSRTSSKAHHETAAEFFKVLYDKGVFIEKTAEQYYDSEAKQFLADRYIIGICPKCAYERAYGDQCEHCGTSLNATDLLKPRSIISGKTPAMKETKHWYLPLDQYQSFLEKWILEEHKEWKPNVYGQCKSWLDSGLHPRAVTRDLDWGVKVPVEEADGKVLYVWFDAPLGYISATKELTSDWEKYWKSDECRMLHFIGKDNIVFHCIIFPTMLKAEGSYILPDNVPANEFLNLEGSKLSTSRNWAVWLHEYLEDFSNKQDVLRYVLTANAPETKDNDFTWKDFQARNNNELVAILGNFVNRAVSLTHKYFEGNIPIHGSLNQYAQEVLTSMAAIRQKIENELETFKFRDALRSVMELARTGNKYLADTEPWKLWKSDPDEVKNIIYVSLQLSANLAIALEPFMPFTAEKLRNLLNIKGVDWEVFGSIDILSEGQTINPPELLFEKIEDEEIQKQIDKLQKQSQANEKPIEEPTQVVTSQKEDITFEDFAHMDIRIGTILEAERVPKTDKLIKFLVDTGLDKRTIISGIAHQWQPEQMVGKQVSVLVNLKPRKMRGIESQGMILFAENEQGKLIPVLPETQVKNGSEVK